MGYTIEYKGSEVEKREAALQDCRDYLGARCFANLVSASREGLADMIADCGEEDTRKAIEFALSFGGIQGLPAAVMVDYIMSEVG